MMILLDAAHPAHVHFLGAIAGELLRRGHRVVLAGRQKDVMTPLLDEVGYEVVHPPAARWPRTGEPSILSELGELVARVRWLRQIITRRDVDLVVTRNPSGVVAARLCGRPSVFDSDDGWAAGRHFALGYAVASVITTPADLPIRLDRRHRPYPGLKSMVYLDPTRFHRDAGVLDRYAIDSELPLVVARFSRNTASHDRGIRSVPVRVIEGMVGRLRTAATLVLSFEGSHPYILPTGHEPIGPLGSWGPERFVDVEPSDFLHLLAEAALMVGDSGSVVMESVALGIPTLRIADPRREIIAVLAEQYGALRDFALEQEVEFLAAVDAWLVDPGPLERAASAAHRRLWDSVGDPAAWFTDLCEDLVSPAR